MSIPDSNLNVILHPLFNYAEVISSFPNQANHTPGGNISSLSLHWSSHKTFIARLFHNKSIFLLQNYKFKLHFLTGFP